MPRLCAILIPMSRLPTRHPPGTPPGDDFDDTVRALVDVVARLRGPDGCPWDRAQTLESIRPHTLEEVYELLEAIDSGDDAAIVGELGDVLLQVLLDAQIAADAGRFTLTDVARSLHDKLVRRHPHVFGGATAENPEDVAPLWDAAKRAERAAAGGDAADASIFAGIPAALPALAKAKKVSARAARAGYDFPDRRMLFDKLREELAELNAELFGTADAPSVPAAVSGDPVPDAGWDDPDRRSRAEAELGDVLFVLANIARRWGLDPEQALRASNRKFETRVRFIEDRLHAAGRTMNDATLGEMEELYQRGKRGGA